MKRFISLTALMFMMAIILAPATMATDVDVGTDLILTVEIDQIESAATLTVPGLVGDIAVITHKESIVFTDDVYEGSSPPGASGNAIEIIYQNTDGTTAGNLHNSIYITPIRLGTQDAGDAVVQDVGGHRTSLARTRLTFNLC